MGCTCLQVQHVAPSAYCLAWVHLTSTAATSDGGVFLRRVDLPSRAAHRKGGVPSFLGDLAFTAAPRDDGALLIWDGLACKCSTSQGRRVACLGCLGLLRLRLVIAACCDHVAVRSILDLLHSSKQNNYLSPHEAQVVLGRLTWVLSSSCASSGRAATLPLVDRAKKRDSLDMPARNQLPGTGLWIFRWNSSSGSLRSCPL